MGGIVHIEMDFWKIQYYVAEDGDMSQLECREVTYECGYKKETVLQDLREREHVAIADVRDLDVKWKVKSSTSAEKVADHVIDRMKEEFDGDC